MGMKWAVLNMPGGRMSKPFTSGFSNGIVPPSAVHTTLGRLLNHRGKKITPLKHGMGPEPHHAPPRNFFYVLPPSRRRRHFFTIFSIAHADKKQLKWSSAVGFFPSRKVPMASALSSPNPANLVIQARDVMNALPVFS